MERFKIGERMKRYLDSFRLKREMKKFNKTLGYVDYAQFVDLMGILQGQRSLLEAAYETCSNKKSVEFLDREGWVEDIINDFYDEGLNNSCLSCLMNSIKYIYIQIKDIKILYALKIYLIIYLKNLGGR